MERDFGVLADFTGGGGQSHPYAGVETAPPSSMTMGVDEAFLNGCFSELSFQSILQPMPASATSFNYYSPFDAGVSAATQAYYQTLAASSSYGYMERTFPASETPPSNTYPLTHQDLKMPKDEHFGSREFAFQLLKLNNSAGVPPEPLINFFSIDPHVEVAGFGNTSDDVFIGSLNSSEQKQNALAPVALYTSLYPAGSVNDMLTVHHHQLTSSSSLNFDRVDSAMNRYMPYSKSSSVAKQRRQRLSEKTSRLQRFLPWDKKMDTGTMLEEAYKYVKFLQAQVSVLQAMALQSTTPPPPLSTSNPSSDDIKRYSNKNTNPPENNVVWGELGKLNRQQLLQVVVNSPAAQTLLYSRGCCVYSREQLALLQKLAEKNKSFWEQMMIGSASFHCQFN